MAKLRARDVFIDQIRQTVPRYGYLRAPVLSPAKLTESGQQRSLLLTDRPIDRSTGLRYFGEKPQFAGQKVAKGPGFDREARP